MKRMNSEELDQACVNLAKRIGRLKAQLAMYPTEERKRELLLEIGDYEAAQEYFIRRISEDWDGNRSQ